MIKLIDHEHIPNMLKAHLLGYQCLRQRYFSLCLSVRPGLPSTSLPAPVLCVSDTVGKSDMSYLQADFLSQIEEKRLSQLCALPHLKHLAPFTLSGKMSFFFLTFR